MGKKIVVSFPGARGCEIPLLYFGAKHFEDMGYEKRFVSYPANREITLENLLNNALEILWGIDWKEYEDVVFIAKSIGTVVSGKAKEMLGIPAKLVLYTPLEQTLAYIRKDNDVILVAMGDEDPYLTAPRLMQHCEKEGIPCHIEPGVGHRMEVPNDLRRNLDIVFRVLQNLDGHHMECV